MTGGISLAPLMTKIKVDINGFKSEMDKASAIGVAKAREISKSMSNTAKVGEGLKKVGGTLTKYVSIPLAGVGIASGKMAMDFGKSFTKVSTLLDSNKTDFGKYKKDILNASTETGAAVGDFTESVYQSISAGVDQKEAIGFTTEAMKLARVGFTEGASSVDLITTALNGYGLEVEETTRVSDILLTTQNAGKTTIDELSQSMGKVIPVASSSNYSIEELSATYATLTKNGIATAEAGTYTRQMLSELTKSGSKADKALRDVAGKGFAQLKKEGVPTTDILKMMNDYAVDNGMTLKDMFGSVEAGTAAMTLFNDGGKEYNEILDKMNNSSGITKETFDEMSESAEYRLPDAINALKNSAIEFGGTFSPIIEMAADLIEKLADKLSGLSEKQMKMIAIVGGLAIAIGPIIGLIGSMMIKYTQLKPIIMGVSATIKSSGLVMAALTNPITLVIGAIVLLAVAVATNFAGIRDTISSVMQSIKEIISTILSWLKTAWENDFMAIRTIAELVWDSIVVVFETVFKVIENIFKIFAAAFKGDWQGVWDGVKKIFSTVWDGIKKLLGNFLKIILSIIIGIGGKLWRAAKGAFSRIKDGFVFVWKSIKSWFSKAVNDPVGTIKGIGGALYSAGESIFNSLKNGMKSVWSGIKSWVGEKVDWLKEKVTFWKSNKKKVDGSHYTGLSNVPFDGYIARLHKGERVLTAKENREYNQGNASNAVVIQPSAVNIDGREVGTITWKVVDENIQRNNRIKKSFT
ncbi:phage tail tape measure protein [Clostridium sp. D2Q-14]|uniref:phage tail tape measure protein n=1 Tax=Anaeromonas gelatinilytica TaxID=2683194 RepID=UPI00193B3FE9|nr:phage tail tape measure protein [Anaeromonas gelatinilytica]MBS4535837.1 phage tail tape measure protein [Anaeromonas gelatinilytica]